MYNKKKKKYSNKLVVIILFIVMFVILFLLFNNDSNYNFLGRTVKNISSNIYEILSDPFITDDNSSLLSEVYIDTLQKEVEELRELLNLNETTSEFALINTTVLNRCGNYWFNSLTVDKGSDDGITVDMIAIDSNGVVGKVVKTTSSSSEVKLLTSVNDDFQVAVAINDSTFGLLNDYRDGFFVVEGIGKYTDVKAGDIVNTSGLGGLFPKGILIGEVEKIENNKNGLDIDIYVKSKVNYNNIYYVSILKRG